MNNKNKETWLHKQKPGLLLWKKYHAHGYSLVKIDIEEKLSI